MAVIGSRGPASHNPDYFKADAQSPCPGEVIEDNRYDVLAGMITRPLMEERGIALFVSRGSIHDAVAQNSQRLVNLI